MFPCNGMYIARISNRIMSDTQLTLFSRKYMGCIFGLAVNAGNTNEVWKNEFSILREVTAILYTNY